MDANSKPRQIEVKQAHQSGNAEVLPATAATASVGNTVFVQQSATSSDHKKEIKQNSTDVAITSGQHHSAHSNSSQTHPKKKGGFVITSVKDNVDGDESADDLDESHASYSDISYSRATDIDHDPESSTSDEAVNVTSPDGTVLQNNVVHNKLHAGTSVTTKESLKTDPSTQVKVHNSQILTNVHDVKGRGEVVIHEKREGKQLSSSEAPISNAQVGGMQSSGNQTEKMNSSLPQTNNQPNQPTLQFKTPAAVKAPNSATSVSAASSAASTTRSSSTSTTTTQKPGSRVYKVFKREAIQPTKRESGRWICYDYGDVQTPNIGFVAPSASDSRISVDQTQGHTNQLPLSISAMSVPSSASAYSLQHSDSTSSIHRDSTYSYGASMVSNATVQHSASASSVNYDQDGRKINNTSKSATETQDNLNRSMTGDDRLSKIAGDQELQNVIHSSGELSNPAETEEESAANVRIDNKIEAAMDLVKKHLMLAVRDEVDVLKERIVELEQEVDVMKGVLTPEQIAHIQPILNKFTKIAVSTSQSQPSHITRTSTLPNTSIQHVHDTTTTSQPSHGHAGHGHIVQVQTVPINPSNRVANPSAAVSGQVKPQAQNVAAAKPNPAPLSHPVQSSQQPAAQTQQPVLQKPPQPTQINRTVNVAYPQGSTTFQPASQQPAANQPQLTAQQIQAIRQQQQVYQQVPAPQSGSQPGYQSPQVVMQQPGVAAVPQQTQLPPGSVIQQPGHPTYQHPHPTKVSQQNPPLTAAMSQPQYPSSSQPSVNRMTSVGGQGPPRVAQVAPQGTTNSGTTPPMHSQSTFQPVSVAPSYTATQVPHLNSAKITDSKASQT